MKILKIFFKKLNKIIKLSCDKSKKINSSTSFKSFQKKIVNYQITKIVVVLFCQIIDALKIFLTNLLKISNVVSKISKIFDIILKILNIISKIVKIITIVLRKNSRFNII